jgi:hypothetical protein
MAANLEGRKLKAKANVDIFLLNPVGVAEHGDTLETIEDQLAIMCDCEEKIGVITKYFRV